jgi:hypothetical protein
LGVVVDGKELFKKRKVNSRLQPRVGGRTNMLCYTQRCSRKARKLISMDVLLYSYRCGVQNSTRKAEQIKGLDELRIGGVPRVASRVGILARKSLRELSTSNVKPRSSLLDGFSGLRGGSRRWLV